MNRLTIHRILWPAVLALSLFPAEPIRPQGLAKLTLPLTINEQQESFANFTIQFDKNASGEVFLGKAPGGVLVSKERVNDPPYAYRIRIDSDGDGNLASEPSLLLLPNSSIIVRVNRKWANGKQRSLPYTIEYSRELDKNNTTREHISWRPHYRAEGKLKFRNCESLFVALDLNGDGLFDERDFAQGTSIGLDRNGDGRIFGKDEWLAGNQIIEYCGTAFLIDGIEPDGARITLSETSLRVPKIGAPLPAFSLTTSEGKLIRLHELNGRMHLLDFWASWCKPCVEKFSLVKQLSEKYGNALAIIAINVDEESNLPMARQIIKDYQLQWPQVMNGQGEVDPVWKAFGGMENNRLAIPLYVLIDGKGVLRYAGNGGEDLSDLRRAVEEILRPSR
jgi:thiol-disulfide isomerase/thioredoxin